MKSFTALCRELLDQGLRADECPLDESDTTREAYRRLDELWLEALDARKRELYLEEMARPFEEQLS